jgi:signal transduction histidine kinase
MKISELIFFSILFILGLFSVTTYINFRQSEEVRANAEYLAMSSTVIRQSNQMQRNVLYMERGLRGYLSTGEEYFRQSYDSAALENRQVFHDLDSLLRGRPEQWGKLQQIDRIYQQWLVQFAYPLLLAGQNRDSTARRFSDKEIYRNNVLILNEERINRDLQQAFRELQNIEYANRAQNKTNLEASERETKLISVALTALSIVVGLVIAVFLARHISRRIATMVGFANRLAEGDYDAKVDGSHRDELSELTDSLNDMAATLSETISLLKRKNEELDQFAHIVSHDLKAPLRGIDNVVTWIEEDHAGELPSKVAEYLVLIRGRISRAENLIEGILSYARIGKEVQEKETVDLNQLIGDLVATLPRKPGLLIDIPQPLPVLRSEKLPLEQIFANLLSNAIKYHDKTDGRIRIYSREAKDRYSFFVEDNGPGIARSYHDKIFVIFQTLQERDSFESTGVGLAIVKKILDDRKEQIELRSEPGKGSIFSFTWSK